MRVWAFPEAVLKGAGRSSGLAVGLCRRESLEVFRKSVPVWVGLSMRLCWQVVMWAFCKAVLAGAGKSGGLFVVRL